MWLLVPSLTNAYPSGDLYERKGHVYDDWGISRTTSVGADGFLALTAGEFSPVLAKESFDENKHIAWGLGKEFVKKFPDKNQRAEQIFYFVRDRVEYVSDTTQFGRGEFAQNADEVAETIVNKGKALGDCEDSAILLSVMYKAAGYRSAMVLTPGHVANLVFLPDYKKAPRKLTLLGEKGWVWGEATGATNRFGWVPETVINGEMIAREVVTGEVDLERPAPGIVTVEEESFGRYSGSSSVGFLSLVGTVGLLVALARGRGSASATSTRRYTS